MHYLAKLMILIGRITKSKIKINLIKRSLIHLNKRGIRRGIRTSLHQKCWKRANPSHQWVVCKEQHQKDNKLNCKVLRQVVPRSTGSHIDKVLEKDSPTCHHLSITVPLFQWGEDQDVQIQIKNHVWDHAWSLRAITLAIDQCSVEKWPREVKVIMKMWSHLPIVHCPIKGQRHKQLIPNRSKMTRRIRRNNNNLHHLKELKESRRVKNLQEI